MPIKVKSTSKFKFETSSNQLQYEKSNRPNKITESYKQFIKYWNETVIHEYFSPNPTQ